MSETTGMMNDNEALNAELAAYAFGSLNESERAQVDARLRASVEARQLLAEYEAVLGLLPHGLQHQSPPPEARAWVMSRAHASTIAARPLRQSWWQRFAQQLYQLNPLRLAVTAGLVIALAGLAFWNVQLQQQLSLVQQSANVNGRVFALAGTGIKEASARLYVEPGLQRGELDVTGLPLLPEDRVYQLWFARPGQPTETGGAFRVDAQGQVVAQVSVPVPLAEVSAIAVTEEAAPGVLRPTTKHLLDAKP